jgi:hypothetical protein
MKKNKFRLLLLATLLTGATLLSGVKSADACIREMCFEVDDDTVCCWSETCVLECWDW